MCGAQRPTYEYAWPEVAAGRNCVNGQRQSQDGGAAAPARKAGLKQSDAAAEYVTADGDAIQAIHVWRLS